MVMARTNPFNRIRPGAPGYIVRRKDSLNRPYHIHRESGKRVSKEAWQLDRERIAFERAVVQKDLEARREVERQLPQFPPHVGPTGVPIPTGGGGGRGRMREQGAMFDFDEQIDEDVEYVEISGEDDTG